MSTVYAEQVVPLAMLKSPKTFGITVEWMRERDALRSPVLTLYARAEPPAGARRLVELAGGRVVLPHPLLVEKDPPPGEFARLVAIWDMS